MTILKKVFGIRYHQCEFCHQHIDEFEDMYDFNRNYVHPDHRNDKLALFCEECLHSDNIDWNE